MRRLLGNASMLAVGRSLHGVFNTAAISIIVRSLGLETFGMLVVIHAVVTTISDIAKFQSWQAVLRYGAPALEENRAMDFRRLIKLTALLDTGSAIFGIAVAVIAAPLLAPRFEWSPELVSAIQLYACSILFMVTATPTGLLRLFDRFDLLSVSKAIGSFARLVGAVWIFFSDGGIESLLLVWFLSTVISGFWLIGHSIRALSAQGLLSGPRLGFRNLGSGHQGILSFVLTTQANTTLSASTTRLPVVIIGLVLSPAAAGLYDIGRQVTTLLARFTNMMRPAIYPEFARLSAQNDLSGIRTLILRTMALMAGVGVALVTPLILFGREILSLIFGPELEAAYGVLVWLAFASAARLLFFPLEPALISTGSAGAALRIRIATVSVYLLVLYVLLPRVGVVAGGIAPLASVFVSFAGQAIAVRDLLRHRSEDSRVSGDTMSGTAPDATPEIPDDS